MFRVFLASSLLLVLLAVQSVVGQQPDTGGLTVHQWSRLLTQRDPRQRSQAAQALGKLGPRAKDAVAALAETLNDTDPDVRLQAATALGRIGAPARLALSHLVAGLHDDDEYARYAASWALERIAADLLNGADTIPAAELAGLAARLNVTEAALREAGAVEPAKQCGQAREQCEQRMATLARAAAPLPATPVPAAPQLTADQPAAPQLAAPQLATDQPGASQPAPDQPVPDQPVPDQPAPDQPAGPVAVLRLLASAPSAPPAPPQPADSGGHVPTTVEVAAPADDAPGEKLLRKMHGQDSLGRVRTAQALARLGEAGVPALIEAIRIEQNLREESGDSGGDVDITPAIFEMLRRMGVSAAPALVESLGDEDLGDYVSYLLEELGPDAHQATPALIEAVKDQDNNEQRRDLAAGVLGAIGPRAREAVPVLIGVLSDLDEEEGLRCTAVLALGRIGEDARQATGQLIEVLRNEYDSDFVRSNVALVLPQVGAPAGQSVPALMSLFDNRDDEDLWSSAIQALAAYGDAAGDAVPVLVRLLDHQEVYVSGAAAQALADIGRTPPDAQEVLIRLLEDVEAEEDTQTAAAAALANIGPPAVAALIDRLDTADQHDCARAAAALARIGPDAAAAVGPLRKILRDEGYGKARRYAAIALGEFGEASRDAVADLAAVVASDSEHPQLRGIAATALGELRAFAGPALPELLAVIQNADVPGSTRAMCVLAIVKISPDGIPALLQALDGDHPVVRVAAARALESAAVVSKHALPALLETLEDPQAGFLACEVLQEMGDVAVWHLLKIIRDEQIDPDTRSRAVRMLGDLYLHDELQDQAVGVLIEVLHEEELRDEVEWALSNCGTAAVPQLLAALDREERRSGGDSPACDTLRSLAVELCVPMGRGGGGGGFGDPTGFEKYDQLDIYHVPPALAGARAASPSVEEFAAEIVPETAVEGHGPRLEPVDAATAAHGIAAIDDRAKGYDTVKVFYGTNREPVGGTVSATGQMPWYFLLTAVAGIATMFFGVFGYLRSRAKVRAALAYCGMLLTVSLAYVSVLATSPVEPAAAAPDLEYGSRHSEVVEMGVCEVSIPKTHEVGQLESPSLLKFEVQEDPQKHIVLRCVKRRAPDQFFDELRDDLNCRGDSILVFIHGYNVTFEDAARRTAQMAHDLEFQGAPMFYSWPSHGNWYRYREDEKNVELAAGHMRRFLVDVARRSRAGSVHLIAHSMGNRALTAALREIEVGTGERGAMFNQVVLAAPDINAEIFKTRIAPAIVPRAERVTLYASSGDLALTASRVFNAGGPRAGDSTDGPLVVPGIETIDVTDVDTSLLGHLYYGSNRSILDDLKLLLVHSRPAADRPQLHSVARGGETYWICQGPETVAREVVSPGMQR